MAARGLVILGAVVLCSLVAVFHGAEGIMFSDLQKTLLVSASPRPGQVLEAGADKITVTWSLNQTYQSGSTDSSYKTVELKLCYAPISQKDRPWRKTVNDNLAKDKTCQHGIVSQPYTPSNSTFSWTISRDVPTATYFIRAYAYNSQSKEVAYGQTTDAGKTTDLFEIRGISGRHVSLDVASAVFSAFSVVSLFGFFYLEKRKAKRATQEK
ncbi:hypothetical protein Nepgr_003074 [Nepenthes gracilis]|uniref:High-affinity nitrate transporter n=1 Tax=Nepenthes gracilis TaxID=150966 RepID=A0AAD3RYU4_NEPGR|nr:hypothetical protein Nepgr_003074 [Nepenthes gracilis]